MKETVKKSLRYSVMDGIAANAMIGCTNEYFTPFLLLLGGTLRHVGILNSLPNLAAALVQLKSPELAEKFPSRKKIIILFVFLQALMLPFMSWMALTGVSSPYYFILLVTLFAAMGAVALPLWGSWMADLVSEKKRGTFFGWRNRILGMVMVAFILLAGAFLHKMQSVNIYYGFAILFGFASIARLGSPIFLNKMHEPPIEHKKEHQFTLVMFLKRIRESNFAKFVLFVATFNFFVNMASPFFAVFMLRDLKFDYWLFSILTVTAQLLIYLMMGRWGRHADRVGNLKVMRITAPIIAILPMLWVINRNPIYLFFVQLISGFAWAGFNLCASNFIYDAVTPPKRVRCISYFNVLNGTALCGGALMGGFLAENLPQLFGFKILTLFFISSVLRMMAALIMPIKVKEVRNVENISNNQLFFSMIGVRPMLGIERKTLHYDSE